MLTKRQLNEVATMIDNLKHFGAGRDADVKILDLLYCEIRDQRPVVIAALGCTGEDGHDGIVDLNIAAEEYLDVLTANDLRWGTQSPYENIQRIEGE